MRALFRDVVLDTRGNALSGVSVQVYDEGTTTPISDTIYSSDTGGGTRANPFIASNGEVIFYLNHPAERVDVRYSGAEVTPKTVTLDGVAPADLGTGGGLPSWFQSGDGSPVGSVTPVQKGALYQDTTNGALYEAVGATSADWSVAMGVVNGVATLSLIPLTDLAEMRLLSRVVGTATSIDARVYDDPDPSQSFSRMRVNRAAGTDGTTAAFEVEDNGNRNWAVYPDGRILMANGNSLYNTPAIPDNSLGADGDWSLGGDGHIYAKASGSWSQKI